MRTNSEKAFPAILFKQVLAMLALSLLTPFTRAAVVDATFTSAASVPVTTVGYMATGNTINLALAFAPPTGTNLTVVNNTGIAFIQGTFGNLAQGQVVNLEYGGVTYPFVADYFGGTGNDLVLRWAATRLVAWGDASYNQVGDGGASDRDIPVAVTAGGALAGRTILRLATGSVHNLVLCSDGGLVAWGSNQSGEFGNGNTTSSAVPVAIPPTGALVGKRVVAVAAGWTFSLALCSDGKVVSFGENGDGQLGNGNLFPTSASVPAPVKTAGALSGKTVVAIAAGYKHSLALCSDGTMVTWGTNFSGQLGNGRTDYESYEPVAVVTTGVLSGKSVIGIAAGFDHNLALCSDGTLVAWGDNYNGQLGNGGTVSSNVPVVVNTTGVLSGKTVIALAADSRTSLALCADGTVAGWGDNSDGRFGTDGTASSSVPVAAANAGVLAGRTVTGIAMGNGFGLALAADGTLASWGWNEDGRLGAGMRDTSSSTPMAVSTLPLASGERFVEVKSDHTSHSLALVAIPVAPRLVVESGPGAVLKSGVGRVGMGSTPAGAAISKILTIRNSGIAPLKLGGLTLDGRDAPDFAITSVPAAILAAGTSTTTSVSFTGGTGFDREATLHLASDDTDAGVFHIRLSATVAGVLAADFPSSSTVPLRTSGLTAAGSQVALSLHHAPRTGAALVVVENTGAAPIGGVFDNLANGQRVTLNYGGVDYQFVANYYGGSGNDLVLQWAETRVGAWGDNFDGQLGNGGTTTGVVPSMVDTAGVLAGRTVTAVAVGRNHSLVLCADSSLAAWGSNFSGQLGDGTNTKRSLPVAVTPGALAGKTVVAVAAGHGHNLALCGDGTLAAWGDNGSGQLGNGTATGAPTATPQAVIFTGALAGKRVTAVAAGYSHSLALCSDGTLVAWGGGGSLGNGSSMDSKVPVAVDATGVLAGKTVVAIAAGNGFSLALCADGTVAAWGNNQDGGLGDGTTISRNRPVGVIQTGVLAGKTVVSVAAGSLHSLALCSDGTLAAWGQNSDRKLGDGTTVHRSVPVAVKPTGALAGRTVVAIHAGGGQSRAWCADGTLVSWGSSGYGGLGDGTSATRPTPVAATTAALVAGAAYATGVSSPFSDHWLWLAALPPPPHMLVEQPVGTGLVNGASTVDFSGGLAGVATNLKFTVKNTAGGPLVISGVSFTGAAAGDYTLTRAPAGAVAAGGTGSFLMCFRPGAAGVRDAVMQIASNDPAVGVFAVNLTGSAGTGTVLAADYATGTGIPLSAHGFTATGHTVAFSLGHAPPVGERLVVVENTGMGFIQGEFDNLAQGQAVDLAYGGLTYHFVANYYGGSGNDLVLLPAGARVLSWGLNTGGQLGNNTTANGPVPDGVEARGVLRGQTVVAVAAGAYHSLALCADGTLAAWGLNTFGQLGDGTTTQRLVPVAVPASGALAGKRVVAIAAGRLHSLALCADGTLTAWGDNYNGQLGDGTTTQRSLPVAVTTAGVLAGRTVVAVAAGNFHSMALCQDGTVVAWGYNYYGQLGNGATTDSNIPVPVDQTGVLAGKTVVALSAGNSHSVALCEDGTLAAWGRNLSNELGDGGLASSTVPVAVSTVTALVGRKPVAIAAGYGHTLALCADGSVVAWGLNSNGQRGDGGTAADNYPVPVDTSGALAGKSVVALTAGKSHSMALGADGALVAWGANSFGQLGDGGTAQAVVPVATSGARVVPGGRFTVIASGNAADHSLGIVNEPPAPRIAVEYPAGTELEIAGSTVNLGSSPVGSGGTRVFTVKNTGTSVLGGFAVTFEGANAGDFSVSVPPAATVAPGAATSVEIAFAPAVIGSRRAVLRIASSDPLNSSVTVNLTGTATGILEAVYHTGTEVPYGGDGFTATGSSVNFTLDHAPATGSTLAVVNNTGLDVIAGVFDNLVQGQVVALRHGGVTYRFVANYYGGSGNDLVLQWAGVRPLAWGANSSGQLGDNTATQRTTPVAVNAAGVLAGKTLVAMAAGTSHSIALAADGAVFSWGSNSRGQLGDGSSTSKRLPVAVSAAGVLAGRQVVKIAAGSYHNLALCADGTLVAWGYNSYGQLGDGSYTTRNAPVAVNASGALAGKRVVAVAAGANHSLALCADGTVAAWGYNTFGQLGDGTSTDSNVPVAVNRTGTLAGKTVIAVAGGGTHSLALCADGTLAAWGGNDYGQLGNGNWTGSNAPGAVYLAGVLKDKTVVDITAGDSHNIVRCADGTLVAWGNGSSGRLGNGASTSLLPVNVNLAGVLAGRNVRAVGAGSDFSLATCADGNLASWGANGSGRLGIGSTVSSNVPVLVSQSVFNSGERFLAAATGPTASHCLALVAFPPPPPSVAVLPASGETETGGTLNGSVNAQGADTTVAFEFGPSTAYGSSVAATPGMVTGMETTTVSAWIGGLLPGTVYHYRLVATSPNGTSYGPDGTLYTAGLSSSPVTIGVQPGAATVIGYQAIPGRSYVVQRSDDGLATWTTIATIVADAGGKVSFSDDSPPAGRAFYRVGLSAQ